ncbi:MAG: TetR/AcrR family transcriptional regulator [Firmicutes bacterium]|jgi:AcrR family transcriptional regulator|nr:TetR/AcrR family transcriptional regulator [Bacillota bacterium]
MEVKEMILETAFESFLESGIDGVSLNTIIKRTGLTKGAFYYHFKDKNELIEEIVSRYFYGSLDSHYEILDNEANSFYEKIMTIVDTFFDLDEFGIVNDYDKLKSYQMLLINMLMKNESLRKKNTERLSKVRKELLKAVVNSQLEGALSEKIDVEKFVDVIMSTVLGSINQWLLTDHVDLKPLLRNNVDAVFKLIV